MPAPLPSVGSSAWWPAAVLNSPVREARLSASERALLHLGRDLKKLGYRFVTVTPASHARVTARQADSIPSLADVFGWNRAFEPARVPQSLLMRMAEAQVLEGPGPLFRSKVRFSTLGNQLFVHSAFPTTSADAVFFGPDTYRFARFIGQSLKTAVRQRPSYRILDVGAGSGAGGLHAADIARPERTDLVLADINPQAVQFSKINAELNGVGGATVVESDLFDRVEGSFDLIIANPPYLVDPLRRVYRHGGGDFGFALSLRIIERGLDRLARGGRLALYTGSAIIDGADLFYESLSARLGPRGVRFHYEEIDPDVFGEELDRHPYTRADRIAAVGVTIDVE